MYKKYVGSTVDVNGYINVPFHPYGMKERMSVVMNMIDFLKDFISFMKLYLYFLIISKIKEIFDLIIKK